MSFAKGHKRVGGRPRGQTNKKTIAKSLVLSELLANSGKDPFQVLIDLLDNPSPMIQLSAARELCQYVLPKKKAIEHSQKGKITHEVSLRGGSEVRTITSEESGEE